MRFIRWAVAVSVVAVVIAWWRHLPAAHPLAAPRQAANASAGGVNVSSKSAASVPGTRNGASLVERTTPENAAALTAALPAPARTIEYVRIDRALIEGKSSPFWQPRGQGRVELPLPEGGSMTVLIDRSEMLGANRFSSTGHVEGQPESRVVFAYNEGFLSGSVDTMGHSYALRPATAEATQFYEVDPTQLAPCGGARQPELDAATLKAAAVRKARQAALAGAASSGSTPTAAASPGAGVEVHLLMLYTQAVKTTLTGAARVAALQSEFDAATAKVNSELAASNVAARVRLVKIAETQYDETVSAANAVQNDALTALYKTADGQMDEIHAIRDQCGADIVCLALNRADSASIGLSFVLQNPTSVDISYGLANPLYAFAVVQYSTVAGTDVVPHELGHVFGCAHARGDKGATGTKDGAFTYSYGYRFFGTNAQQYHDIMAYTPGTGLSYYSNPDVIAPPPISAPTGVAPGQPGEADCALTIERNAFEVSTYRLQSLTAPVGTLINVSTRAYVGTGDQVLIAGFYIDGTQPKRVLIRGAGPALVPYGVTNALSNPAVEVHTSDTTLLAANDDWGTQVGGVSPADVAAVGGQVGAFPFAAGSRDSALLTTLNPGSYTAIVQAVGGGSGSALVEVYDVDRAGNKIINLSTRGYADVGQEMFGGFAVQGDPGTTKRILIQVLGPSLANYGVTGSMFDPTLELHDGAGDLLMKNDDWSSGTVAGTASTTNDFHPLVKSYGEQHIFATGHAPANRREPAILVDLPPGNYSVIVRPFEDLTRTPPETAQPGVALVEVYEITQ